MEGHRREFVQFDRLFFFFSSVSNQTEEITWKIFLFFFLFCHWQMWNVFLWRIDRTRKKVENRKKFRFERTKTNSGAIFTSKNKPENLSLFFFDFSFSTFFKLLKIAENVQHRQWIAYQQRLVLSSLIYPNRSDVNVQQKNSLKKLQLLDRISFVDSYKLFQYLQDAPYLRFLTFLRQQPNILAQCLAQTEKVESSISSSTIPILMSSIYNQCLFHDDENFLLELLRSLIEIQLKNDQNPRILLQRSTCSFKILFDAFLTASPSCKLCKFILSNIFSVRSWVHSNTYSNLLIGFSFSRQSNSPMDRSFDFTKN